MEKQHFQKGNKVHALLNGVFQAAVVEDVEEHPNKLCNKYYVHWIEHDRRLDQWLPLDAMRASTAPTSVAKTGKSAKATSSVVTTRRSRVENPIGDEHIEDVTTAGPSVVALLRTNKGSGASNSNAGSKFFGRPKNVQTLFIGPNELDVWYFSPFLQGRPAFRRRIESCAICVRPDAELTIGGTDTTVPSVWSTASALALRLCPCCLLTLSDESDTIRHLAVCSRRPPGREIYRDMRRNAIVFEVEGAVDAIFCQRLALLSKFFLEHKALDYDTSPFVFYVLTVVSDVGCEIVGYFSREKENCNHYNLSCIMTLPHFQGRGAGRFLIDLSYEMSSRMGEVGSPEKPLSDLGERTYRSYWNERIIEALIASDAAGSILTVDSLSRQTAIAIEDVTATLQRLHIIDGRLQSSGASANTAIRLPPQIISEYQKKRQRTLTAPRDNFTFEKYRLIWFPSNYLTVKVRHSSMPNQANVVFLGCDANS